jgi:hypothetical protein
MKLIQISLAVAALALSTACLAGEAQANPAAASGQQPAKPIQQLRIYQIFDHNKAAFHARFRDHAARIMRRYAFTILSMWEARHAERTEFVYLLSWPDAATMERQWSKFMADEEWAMIKQRTAAEHGQLVGEIESRVLQQTNYSP